MTTKGTKEWASKNINPSMGCPNNCKYCYAKYMACYRYRGNWKKPMSRTSVIRENWHLMENKPFNKIPIPTVKPHECEFDFMMPSSHDITLDNVDLVIKVAKEKVLKKGYSVLLTTKPDPRVIRKICQELDDYKEPIREGQSRILFRFTITTLNQDIADYWETNAPSIKERLKALEHAYSKGFSTSISNEPFLDGTGEEIRELVERVSPFVTNVIWTGPMNQNQLFPDIKEQTVGFRRRYEPNNLLEIKRVLDDLHKVVYKDGFVNAIKRAYPHLSLEGLNKKKGTLDAWI